MRVELQRIAGREAGDSEAGGKQGCHIPGAAEQKDSNRRSYVGDEQTVSDNTPELLPYRV